MRVILILAEKLVHLVDGDHIVRMNSDEDKLLLVYVLLAFAFHFISEQCFGLRKHILFGRYKRHVIIEPELIGVFQRSESEFVSFGLNLFFDTDNALIRGDHRVYKTFKNIFV